MSGALLELRALSFAYPSSGRPGGTGEPGGRPLLQDLALQIEAGELVGVLGPNGAGKSTLLSLICGLLKPAAGQVLLGGKRASTLGTRARARAVALVPQDTGAAFPFSVLETVLMGRTPYLGRFGFETDEDLEIAERAIEATGLQALKGRRIDALSGGERQRVLIARALAQDTPLLLCDEPTAHLDIRHQVEVYDLIWKRCRAGGHAALCVLHDLNLAAAYCDRILLLDGSGGVAALGPTEEVMSYVQLTEIYQTEIWVGRNDLTGSLTLAPVAGHSRQ